MGAGVTRIWQWSIDRLAAALEPAEREAVCGDLAESGAAGWPAARDLLGLVIRRQAQSWKDWRPWVALVFLVAPIGYLLGFGTFALAGNVELNIWLIQNYADMDRAILHNSGYELSRSLPLLAYLTLYAVARSWIAGYVLADLSRRALGVTASLLWVWIIVSELLTGPRYRFYVAGTPYTTSLFGVIFPLVLIAVAILPSVFWGMRHGLRRTPLPLGWMIPVVLAIPGAVLTRTSPMAFVLEWPAFYVVAVTAWRWSEARTRRGLPTSP